MHEKLSPWLPAIMCGVLSLITVVTDIFGRFATGTANLGLSTFLCFLPMCLIFVGIVLNNLRDENRELKRRLDETFLKDDNDRKKTTSRTASRLLGTPS